MLYNNKKIEKVNYEIYLKWFDEFTRDLPLNGIIYIKTDPEMCNKRIAERNRKGETIPLDYSIQCHNYHEEWLNKTKSPVLVLDGNRSHKTHITDDWLSKIKTFIHPNINQETSKYNNFDWQQQSFC